MDSQQMYDNAAKNPHKFWAQQARRLLSWDRDFTQTLDWSTPPFARWFADGKLNACYNAVDRHIEWGNGDRIALYFEEEAGGTIEYTYNRLSQEINKTANILERCGIKPGDRVAIYLPLIPKAIVAVLACARIGAVHSVIFGGFSANALRTRIDDAEAKVLITADRGFRNGKTVELKKIADTALAGGTPSIKQVLVTRRDGAAEIAWAARDVCWDTELLHASSRHHARAFDAEHPLFVLYTSGTTGKPKGILHTTGGYLTQAAFTHRSVFDLQPNDIYWCTADIGWITGHSYVAYAPLVNGASQVIYEGALGFPHQGRWWEIVEKYKVSVLYTSPTAIRTMMKWGEDIPNRYDLSSIRILGSVGEPISPKTWAWYHRVIGNSKVPVVDTWWQTETGAIMIAPSPGLAAIKPGSVQRPIPGVDADVVDDNGISVNEKPGYLAIKQPWPSMLRNIWGDPERYKKIYWKRFKTLYFAGDGALRDADGDIWVQGRIDDVMNVSGHRLSTAEIESSLISYPNVAEAAVVGADDDTTGEAIVAFVVIAEDAQRPDSHVELLREHVKNEIGAIAKPKSIFIVSELPKTRSGKIMRRLLKDVANNHDIGDVTTLTDTSVMLRIIKEIQSQ